jgi:ABC-type polysaccharide/polyol phosphate export permease
VRREAVAVGDVREVPPTVDPDTETPRGSGRRPRPAPSGGRSPMALIADVIEWRELVVNLTLREIRSKYKRTVLGHVWSLLNPLASMLIFTVVFHFIVRVRVGPGEPSGLHTFALWLLCGLLPWNFLNNGLNGGMSSLVGNANLIKKVYFPREVLVIGNVLSWMVSFIIEMGVLTVVVLGFGGMPLPWLPLVVAFILVQTVFVLGVALLFSVANVYFRDTQHFLAIALQMWFYLTPIVYPATLVFEHAAHHPSLHIAFLYGLNPMERFTSVFRALMYDNRWPATGDALWCLGWALGTLLIGTLVFRRHAGRIAEEL